MFFPGFVDNPEVYARRSRVFALSSRNEGFPGALIEALDAGAVELVGTCVDTIVDRATVLLTDPDEYARHQIDQNPYGDGKAAGRIVDLML